MASPQAYCRPGDDIAPDATWSVTSGAANAAFPVSNVANRNPAKVFKATSNAVTIRATFPGARVIVGVAIVNHNLAGASVTLTSGSGLSVAVPIAANAGGFCVNAVLDASLSDLSERTSTTFNLVITGGALGNIAIGEVLLLTAIRDLTWIWGLTIRPKRLIVRAGDTFGGTHLQYNKRVRVHVISAQTDLQSEEAAMRVLEEEAQGEYFPWLLIPDRLVNACLYVQFVPGTFAWTPQAPGFTDIPIECEELSSGPPLFP